MTRNILPLLFLTVVAAMGCYFWYLILSETAEVLTNSALLRALG